MKRILLPLFILSTTFILSCSSKKTEPREMVLLSDPAHNSSLATDTARSMPETNNPVEETKQASAPVKKYVRRKPAPRSTAVYNEPTPAPAPAPAPAPSTETATVPAPAPAPGNTETAGTGDGDSKADEAKAETAAKKKGISNGAKGAIIGGVGGAVAGAVIGKNAKGAVIGGVIGAAGGYILGKKKDKKQASEEGN